MDSFLYNPKPSSLSRGLTVMNRGHEPESEPGSDFSGAILEIDIHHARNIHNICIYDNQDVYAKFSLTSNPDETLSTSIIQGGGKNPEFNQSMAVKVNHAEAVLKCEMWMLSRARNYMEDQLLGFALVPLSGIVGNRKVTADYSLSSTDLFHSPAGTVRLSFKLDTCVLIEPSLTNLVPNINNSSIASEVVLLERNYNNNGDATNLVLVHHDHVEYSRIEFPDMNVDVENQQMVSEYFINSNPSPSPRNNNNGNGNGNIVNNIMCPAGGINIIASFLKLGSASPSLPLFENDTSEISKTRVDSAEKKPLLPVSKSPNSLLEDQTLTTRKVDNNNEDRDEELLGGGSSFIKKVFSKTDMEAEQQSSAMQQQIVGMYMKSMKQFTESLAKMKLPIDLDKIGHEIEDEGDDKKKDGSARVFYGSRAFF